MWSYICTSRDRKSCCGDGWGWRLFSVNKQLSTGEPRAGSEVVRIDPLRFLAGCCKLFLATKAGCICLCHCTVFVLFIRATFCALLVYVGMCSVCWLFRLSCRYLPSHGLERLLWGSLIVARGSSPQSPGWKIFYHFLGLVYCFIVLSYVCLVPTWYISYSCPFI